MDQVEDKSSRKKKKASSGLEELADVELTPEHFNDGESSPVHEEAVPVAAKPKNKKEKSAVEAEEEPASVKTKKKVKKRQVVLDGGAEADLPGAGDRGAGYEEL